MLVYDRRAAAVCRALTAVAAKARIGVTRVSIEREWPAIRAVLDRGGDVVVFLEIGESHHTLAVLRYLSPGRPLRAYRLFGATADTIRHGFRRRQTVLRRRNWDLIERARRAGRLTVDSDRGTRLTVKLDRDAAWTNAYGAPADGYPGVWPPAEVNTSGAVVDGVLVVDGAIGSNLGWPLDARVRANPVTLRVTRSAIVDVDSRHALVRDLVREFVGVPARRRVVEVGIGTNDGIPSFVPADILLNERVAGFHLGVGRDDAADARQNVHLDFIVSACRIAIGSDVVFDHGRFAPAAIRRVPDRRTYGVPVTLHDAV